MLGYSVGYMILLYGVQRFLAVEWEKICSELEMQGGNDGELLQGALLY
jgi:hypothetical protein